MKAQLQLIFNNNFQQPSAELNESIKTICREFVLFFHDSKNKISVFLASCYLHRDALINNYTDIASKLASTLLNKLEAYKTVALITFFENNLSSSIERDIYAIEKKLRRFFDNKSLVNTVEMLTEYTQRVDSTLCFMNASFAIKREHAINNPLLSNKVTPLTDKLIKWQTMIQTTKKELEFGKTILPVYINYTSAFTKIKTIDLCNTQSRDRLKAHKILYDFKARTQRLENMLYFSKYSSTSVYRQLIGIVESNRIAAEEYRALCLLIHK